MFTRRKGETQPRLSSSGNSATAQVTDPGEQTVISGDMTVSGDLNCRGTVVVGGRVFGDITAQTIVIQDGAHVEGAIDGETVTINGNVGGPVRAPSVAIGSTARVVGTITHHTLAIEPGAIVEGRAPWRPRPDWENQ